MQLLLGQYQPTIMLTALFFLLTSYVMDGASNILMSGANYPLGLTTVTCRANDTALNEGSCEFNITVVGTCCLSLFIDVYPTRFLVTVSRISQTFDPPVL